MFKDRFDLYERIEEYNRINYKFPEKIPIICEIDPKDNQIDRSNFTRNKYLVDKDLTIGQFMYVVRKRIKVPPEKALFLIVGNGVIPPTGEIMSSVYQKHKDKDHFIYFCVCSESTFG